MPSVTSFKGPWTIDLGSRHDFIQALHFSLLAHFYNKDTYSEFLDLSRSLMDNEPNLRHTFLVKTLMTLGLINE